MDSITSNEKYRRANGQPDTLAAAQSGLKKPFALPPQAQSESATPKPPAKLEQ
jgi:hypothetical protein